MNSSFLRRLIMCAAQRRYTPFILIFLGWTLYSYGIESDGDSLRANAAYEAELDRIIDQIVQGHSEVGVELRDCITGKLVFERNSNATLNPASNLKLLTSAVALQVLGPAFRFKTTLLRDGPIEDGVLNGNLYIRGEGDPQLVYETVWKLVKDMQAQGIREISGDLIADDFYFDDVRTIPDWEIDDSDDETHPYNAPLGALSVNFNTVAMVVRPGKTPGAPVIVAFETPTDYVKVENKAVTVRGRARRPLQFARTRSDGGPNLILAGQMQIGAGYRRFYRTITDPPAFAVTLVAEMMKKEGIIFRGSKRRAKTPAEAVTMLYHWSRPLDILLKYMNKLSSNFISEQVLKTMGAEVFGEPGTTAKGIRVLRKYLENEKLDWSSAKIFNGSGLSNNSRVSPHQMVDLLCHIERDFTQRYDFLATLPIAGVDGTLRRRLRNTGVEGNLRAKTGSVEGVLGLSGMVRTSDGRELMFSFLVNDIHGSVSRVREAQDRWVTAVVEGPTAFSPN